jgi:hypothetical protein
MRAHDRPYIAAKGSFCSRLKRYQFSNRCVAVVYYALVLGSEGSQ